MLSLILGLAFGQCRSTPEYRARVAKYGTEFAAHATAASDDIYTPVVTFDIDTSTLTPSEQHAVSVVYRFLPLVFAADASLSSLTVTASNTSDPNLLGVAIFNENKIVMYTSNIPSHDAFVVVFLHEVLHFLGFGPLAAAGHNSFVNRSHPLTLEHNSTKAVMECAKGRDPAHDKLFSDASRSHWNVSMTAFVDDVMLPTIRFDRSILSRCSVLEVLVSRPWQHRICVHDDECIKPSHCTSLGRHWPRVCRHLTPSAATVDQKSIVQFCIFSAVVGVIIGGIAACNRNPLEIYVRYAKATKAIW